MMQDYIKLNNQSWSGQKFRSRRRVAEPEPELKRFRVRFFGVLKSRSWSRRWSQKIFLFTKDELELIFKATEPQPKSYWSRRCGKDHRLCHPEQKPCFGAADCIQIGVQSASEFRDPEVGADKASEFSRVLVPRTQSQKSYWNRSRSRILFFFSNSAPFWFQVFGATDLEPRSRCRKVT